MYPNPVRVGPYSCSPYVYQLIITASERHQVPWCLLFGICAAESGLNPGASNITEKEASYGLLQLNTRGGQGAGYIPADLLDPAINLRIGTPPIAAAYLRAQKRGLYGDRLIRAVCASSGHPRSDGVEDVAVYTIASVVRTCTLTPDNKLVTYPPPPF